MEILREGRWRFLLFCFLGWVCDFYSLILYTFLMPAISRDLGLVDKEQAWINGLSLLATAIGGFLFGRVADRAGRRPAFALSVGLYSVGSGLCAFADGFWSMLSFRFLTGLGVGGEWGIGQAIAAENVPLSMRGRASGLLQAGGPTSMALAAVVGSFLAPQIGWRECFLWSTSPILLAVSSLWVLPGTKPRPRPALDLLRGELRRPSGAIFLLLTLNMAAFWCTYSFLPKYLQADLAKSPEFVGWFQLVLSTFHLLGNLSFGWLADRLPRPRVFTAYALFFAGGMLAVAAFFPFLAARIALLTAVLAAAGLGAGNWSCFGALFADHFPPEVRGTVSSGFYSASRGVQLLTQHLVVSIAAAASIPAGRSGLFLGALFSALAAAAVRILPERPVTSVPEGRYS